MMAKNLCGKQHNIALEHNEITTIHPPSLSYSADEGSG